MSYEFDLAMRRLAVRRMTDVACNNHLHNQMEVVIVVEGVLGMHIGSKRYDIPAGSAAFVEPYEMHSFYTEQPNVCYILEHPADLCHSFYEWLKKHRTETHVTVLRPETYAYVMSLLPENAQMRNRFYNQATYEEALIFPLCQDFISGCCFSHEEQKKDEVYISALKLIAEYIETEPLSDLKLTTVAKKLCVHPVTLSQKFVDKGNMTYTAYVQYLRVCKAIEMLRRGTPIADAAYGAGFGCIRSFNRVFRHITGVTPSEFLKIDQNSAPQLHDPFDLFVSTRFRMHSD